MEKKYIKPIVSIFHALTENRLLTSSYIPVEGTTSKFDARENQTNDEGEASDYDIWESKW